MNLLILAGPTPTPTPVPVPEPPTDNSGLAALAIAAIVCIFVLLPLLRRWEARDDDGDDDDGTAGGVRPPVTPRGPLSGVSALVRAWVNRIDPPKTRPDTPPDPPVDPPADTSVADGCVRIGHDRVTRIKVPQMARLDVDQADDPRAREPADPETVRSWIQRERTRGTATAEIYRQGMVIFAVSESTMKRRDRESRKARARGATR